MHQTLSYADVLVKTACCESTRDGDGGGEDGRKQLLFAGSVARVEEKRPPTRVGGWVGGGVWGGGRWQGLAYAYTGRHETRKS